MSERRKRLSEFLQPQVDVDFVGVHPDLPKAMAENGNDLCADCNAPSPGWVEHVRCITVCRSCAAVHNTMGATHVEVIKAGKEIDDSVVKRLSSSGNEGSNSELEAYKSKAYRRPSPGAYDVYRKQFINAKYLRREFCVLEAPGLHRQRSAIPQPYITGEISYPLMKRGREKDLWQARSLEAYAASGKLRYMDKERRECGSIPLGTLNVALVSAKDMNGEGDELIMVVTYPEDIKTRKPSESESTPSAADTKEGKETRKITRSLFFKGFDYLNGRDIVEWFVAIRYAKMVSWNAVNAVKGNAEVTSDFKKLGWLHKKGTKVTDQFRLRWFVLEKNVVRYSEYPMDAVPKKEFELQHGPGYGVIEGIEGDDVTPFAFTVITPTREYYMHATSETYRSWLQAFGSYCLQSGSLSTDY